MAKKKSKWFLICLVVFILIVGTLFVSNRSRENNASIYSTAFSFAYALRDHNEEIYELSDPKLWPRIEEWMMSHNKKVCIEETEEINIGSSINDEVTSLVISCYLENGSIYIFKINGLIVKASDDGYLVMDWGEIDD